MSTEQAIGQTEMPKYKCHKEVHAMKIIEVIDPTEPNCETDGRRVLKCESGGEVVVDHAYVRKHNPVAGGYYVLYADGYQSFSPAEAFEKGYTEIKPGTSQYINIQYQDGPIKENGVNGCQIDDVLKFALATLNKLNSGQYHSHHNVSAISHLEYALSELEKRTADRETRGVEGTSAV